MLADLDRLVMFPDGSTAILEIKTERDRKQAGRRTGAVQILREGESKQEYLKEKAGPAEKRETQKGEHQRPGQWMVPEG